MKILATVEKCYTERILDMGGGHVMGFTDLSFGEFFKCYDMDIHGSRFLTALARVAGERR